MTLTDHTSRNPEKQLLRRRIGYVHSWVQHGSSLVGTTSTFHNGVKMLQKLPKTVFLKFEGAEWTLPGLKEKGLYPICPRKATCKQPRKRDTFTPAQWQLRDEARTSKTCLQLKNCSICNEALQQSQFSISQWKNAGSARKCNNCLKEKIRLERSDICYVCNQRKEKSQYSQDQWRYCGENARTCHQCLNKRKGTDICSVCKKRKVKKRFSETQWTCYAETERTCRKCNAGI